ncbi:MAG TPA: creatininase family protein [Anaerovoracaceae bacterium]|nr:creatininase family protein [Anaerovoracaceae bacterium]
MKEMNPIHGKIKYDKHNLYWCNPGEVAEWLKKTDIIMLPLGSVEQHGPYVPISMDCLSTELVTERLANRCDIPYFPQIYPGYTPYHMWQAGVPKGSVTLRYTTYCNMVYDLIRCLIHNGFNKILLPTGHTGNLWPLDTVMRRVRMETGAFVASLRVESEIFALIKELNEIFDDVPEKFPWKHAAEAETACALLYDEELVDKSKYVEGIPHNPDWLPENFSMGDGVPAQCHFKHYSKLNHGSLLRTPFNFYEFSDPGHAGSPYNASVEKGEALYGKLTDIMADMIEEIKKIEVNVHTRDWSAGMTSWE